MFHPTTGLFVVCGSRMPAHKGQQRSWSRNLILWLMLVGASASSHAQRQEAWRQSWTAAQQAVCDRAQLPAHSWRDASLQQIVHLSLGGEKIRLRLSNAFGQEPLSIRSVTVAPAHASASGVGPATPPAGPWQIEADRGVAVQFHQAARITIPAGAEYLSDPIALHVQALSNLAVTFTVEAAPACATSHPGARTTSFLVPGGEASGAASATEERFPHWYFLSGVEVWTTPRAASVVVLGDSITDGHGATDDADNRWTDVLAARLAPLGVGVLNAGIGGNRILAEGLGPSAVARLDRDVLAASGVRTLIVLEGINDLGSLDRLQEHTQAEHDALVAALEEAVRQMAMTAHAHGIRVLAATLTPFAGSGYYHPSARTENDRQRFNQWLRSADALDGVVDFDALLRDPAHPDRLAADLDSGDHLHPGPAGYRRMGEGVSLLLFK